MTVHLENFTTEAARSAGFVLAQEAVYHEMVMQLQHVRARAGRLFVLGLGGGAGHASHAASDFRKLCGIEAYAPSDNVSELTARANDNGWDTIYSGYLMNAKLRSYDGLFIFSVGGGDEDRKVSMPLVRAMEAGHSLGCYIMGVVGRHGGVIDKWGTAVLYLPNAVEQHYLTPIAESIQALVWHALVSDPDLQVNPTKW